MRAVWVSSSCTHLVRLYAINNFYKRCGREHCVESKPRASPFVGLQRLLMALYPSLGPGRIFQFLNLINSRQDSLGGGSALS
jgi:hypothetical protein